MSPVSFIVLWNCVVQTFVFCGSIYPLLQYLVVNKWSSKKEGTWNPTIYNIIRWFAGLLGRMTRGPSVWCSKHYFFIISYGLIGHSKLFILIFENYKKINWDNFCKELEHQSCLSQGLSHPVYYIEDWQIYIWFLRNDCRRNLPIIK